jgi:hypothetical protein
VHVNPFYRLHVHGQLDYMFNNAGIGVGSDEVRDLTLDQLLRAADDQS